MLVLFKLLPVVLAIVAVLYAAANFKHLRSFTPHAINYMGMISAMLLITAQSAFFAGTIDVNGIHVDFLARQDIVWGIFNCLCMVLVILVTKTMKTLEAQK